MTSPSYCAPCIADLALVRDAVTSVAGTASCMAHAVLLTHSSDDPGRRRHRLDALRDLANSKAETAEPAEQVKLELLVQEYGLAGAMDMGGPARRAPQPPRQGTPSPPGEGRKSRRGRARPDRPAGEHGPRHGERPGGERPAGERPNGERPGGGRGERPAEAGETAPVTPAPGPAGEGAPVEAVAQAVESSGGPESSAAPTPAAPEQSAPAAPEQPTPAAPQPTPEQPTPAAPAPEQPTPAAPQPTPEQARPESAPAGPPTSDPDA